MVRRPVAGKRIANECPIRESEPDRQRGRGQVPDRSDDRRGWDGRRLRGAPHGRRKAIRREVPAPIPRRAARHPDALSSRGKSFGSTRKREHRGRCGLRYRTRRGAIYRDGVSRRREPRFADRATGASAFVTRGRSRVASQPGDPGRPRRRHHSSRSQTTEPLRVSKTRRN
jgi:hypothetical protein